VNKVTVPIAGDLYFDVARFFDNLLDVDFAVVKRALGFAGGVANGGFEIAFRVNAAHSFTAAARSCLEQHRIAKLPGKFSRLVDIGGWFFTARNDRDIGGLCDQPRRGLRAHAPDRVGGRPDEHDAADSHAAANSAFSLRNPYPGWIAPA